MNNLRTQAEKEGLPLHSEFDEALAPAGGPAFIVTNGEGRCEVGYDLPPSTEEQRVKSTFERMAPHMTDIIEQDTANRRIRAATLLASGKHTPEEVMSACSMTKDEFIALLVDPDFGLLKELAVCEFDKLRGAVHRRYMQRVYPEFERAVVRVLRTKPTDPEYDPKVTSTVIAEVSDFVKGEQVKKVEITHNRELTEEAVAFLDSVLQESMEAEIVIEPEPAQ